MSSHGTVVPPPLFYLAAIAIAIGANMLLPLRLPPGRWRLASGVASGIIATGIIVAVLVRFRRAGTTFDVRKKPTTLVADGPFRFSRHPAYLALTVLYLAAGLLLDNGWSLLLLAPVLLVMDRWILPGEESRLEMVFGDRYRRYMSTVRRWL